MTSNAPYYHRQTSQSQHVYATRSSQSDLLCNGNADMAAQHSPESTVDVTGTGSNHIDQSVLYTTLSHALTNDGYNQLEQEHVPSQHSQQNQIDDKLLEAVTSAAAGEERLHKIGTPESRGDSEEQSTDGERQQRTAEQAVSLLGPTISNHKASKRRTSVRSTVSKGYGGGSAKEVQFNHFGSVEVENGLGKRRKLTKEQSSLANDDQQLDHAGSTSPNNLVDSNNRADDDSSFFVNEYPSLISSGDAPLSGIYSAAALFRKPSLASKKYTRPPMSKLFASLQVSAEDFLRLQAAAKNYMLDPEHPERKDCVGNRGKGDSDMVKLKLYHCVKDFLERDSVGESFFGAQSANVESRSWMWPRDLNRVVALVTPLLRRMVTNERQRQYAIQTRKGEGGSLKSTPQESKDSSKILDDHGFPQNENNPIDPSILSTADSMPISVVNAIQAVAKASTQKKSAEMKTIKSTDGIVFRFCIIRATTHNSKAQEQELVTSFEITSNDCSNYDIVYKIADGICSMDRRQESPPRAPSETAECLQDEESERADIEIITRRTPTPQMQKSKLGNSSLLPRISVLLPSGVVDIVNEDTWQMALQESINTVWMEERLKIIIEI